MKNKHHRLLIWLFVVLGIALSFAGFFYAYYYSWILATPGLTEQARSHYDLVSKLVGIPSLLLFGVSLVSGLWLLISKRWSK